MQLIVVFIFTLFLYGCGVNSVNDNDADESPGPYTISGTIVDGYIKNATVCIDDNDNKLCDANESATLSDDNGRFSIPNLEFGLKNVLTIGGTDTSTYENFKGINKFTIEIFKADADIFVTPYTTILSNMYAYGQSLDQYYSIDDAKARLSLHAGIKESDIFANPMLDIDLFAKTQKIIQAVSVLQYAIQGDDSNKTSNEDAYRHIINHLAISIYKDRSATDVNISKAIERLETTSYNDAPIVISQEIEDFVVGFTDETIKKIGTYNGTALTLDNLASLQNGMKSFLKDSSAKIANEEENNLTQTLTHYIDNDIEPIMALGGNLPAIVETLEYHIAENSSALVKIEPIIKNDDNDVLTYALGNEKDELFFDIDSNGYLSFKIPPDYETKKSYNISYYTNDGYNNVENYLVILIDNVTDTVPTLAVQTLFVASGASVVGGLIGDVIVEDVGDTAITSYTLTGANANDLTIDNNGKIYSNSVVSIGLNEANIQYSASVKATNDFGDSNNVDINIVFANDYDNDYIPDDIERMIGLDYKNADENSDGIVDGLDSISDVFFKNQWHIRSEGTIVNNTNNVSTIIGNDLNLSNIYHKYTGKGVNVQIVDNGTDADHEDLIQNIDLQHSVKVESGGKTLVGGDPSASSNANTHGTMVAGIIGARAFNGIGVRGIAPFSSISACNWLDYQTTPALAEAWLINDIAISNNSWGAYYSETISEYDVLLEYGTTNNRDGKGTIYLFAAGNSRELNHDFNYQGHFNSRYVIPVASLNHENNYSSYSSKSMALLVSGYGGEYYNVAPTIGTTTIQGEGGETTWINDDKKNYTYIMNGTSSAAPTVAGSLALVLEACPNLSWRDVKNLIAITAIQVGSDDRSQGWFKNGAGLHFSINYGYGLINPEGMIAKCTASNFTSLPVEKIVTKTIIVNDYIDYSTDMASPTETVSGFHIYDIDIPEDMIVEHVEVNIDTNHSVSADLRINLKSPDMSMYLDCLNENELWATKAISISPFDWMNGGHRIGTAAYANEHSKGIWRIKMADYKNDGHSGTIKTIKLTIYGH